MIDAEIIRLSGGSVVDLVHTVYDSMDISTSNLGVYVFEELPGFIMVYHHDTNTQELLELKDSKMMIHTGTKFC